MLETALTGGILTWTRMVTGVLRSKMTAVTLGEAGVGLLSQITQVQLLGIGLGTLALSSGIITRLQQVRGDPQAVSRILRTSFTAQIGASLLFVGVSLAAHPSKGLTIVLASVPFMVLASGHLAPLYFAFGRFHLYVWASLWAVLLSFGAAIASIYTWGILGACGGIALSGVFLFGSLLYFLRQVGVKVGDVFCLGFDWPEFLKLTRFGFVVTLAGALGMASNLWIRSEVIRRFGTAANGLVQVPIALSAYYIPLLTQSLWATLHPRVSANPSAVQELSKALRFVALGSAGMIVAIFLFRTQLIRLAYSPAFLPAERFVQDQLEGDFFYLIWLTVTVYWLGTGRLMTYLLGWGLFYGALTAMTAFLFHSHQEAAVFLGYRVTSEAFGMAAALWTFLLYRGKNSASVNGCLNPSVLIQRKNLKKLVSSI